MTKPEHLWAIGYDDMGRAEQVRDEIISLGWDTHYLDLLDVAVVVRHPDGSFTCNREPFPAVANILGCTVVGFLAGLVPARAADGRGRWRLARWRWHRCFSRRGRDRGRLRPRGGRPDAARDVSPVRLGQRRGYGGDTAYDTGVGRDSVKEQRGRETSTVDSVDPGRCCG